MNSNANNIVWEIGKLTLEGEGCPEHIEKMVRDLEKQLESANRYRDEQIAKVKGYNELRNYVFNQPWTNNQHYRNQFKEKFSILENGGSIR